VSILALFAWQLFSPPKGGGKKHGKNGDYHDGNEKRPTKALPAKEESLPAMPKKREKQKLRLFNIVTIEDEDVEEKKEDQKEITAGTPEAVVPANETPKKARKQSGKRKADSIQLHSREASCDPDDVFDEVFEK